MEVHEKQPGGLNPGERRLGGDLQDADRLRTRRAHREISRSALEKKDGGAIVLQAQPQDTVRRDRLDISPDRHPDAADPARVQHLDELARAHEAGRLNTPDRIAKAAERILRG